MAGDFHSAMDGGTQAAGPEAFMALYTQHHQRLFRYIVTLTPAVDVAEEILSETSMVLWRQFDQFTPGSNFFAWSCRIARNLVRQHYRRASRSPQLLDDAVLEQVAAAAEASIVAVSDWSAHLKSCLGRLSAADRELIEARYVRNNQVQSLAAERGRSANALGKSLARIRTTLLECIRRTRAAEQRAEEAGG